MKRKIKKILKYLFLALLVCVVVYVWKFLPIICGHVAKEMCSDVFVSGRIPDDVAQHETSVFPFNLASYAINMKDSSVSASVFGFAKRKAIYRKGLGATLINGISETGLRNQSINVAGTLSIDQETINFPQGNRVDDTLNKDIDKLQLDTTIRNVFRDSGIQTRAVVVVYDGKIIGEKYAAGYSASSKLLGWSMTKGIVNALIGILAQQGKLNINSPAPIEQWKNDERKRITIADLMHMSSGLKFWRFP